MTTTFDTLKATTRLAARDGGSTARSVDAPREPPVPFRITAALRGAVLTYSVVVTVYLVLALDDAMRSAMARGLVEVMYHAMTRTASVGTALAAVIVGLEGVTMTFLKREREKGRSEGRREGRLEGMRERDREWKDWQERLRKDPNAEPPPPPKDDD